MRTVARALFALREASTAPVGHRAGLDGDGIGATVYRGRACVATDPGDALDRLEPGDVLVAFGTTPAYNLVLSIVGAVVVEEGGLLSHAAVIARELGLSAVIGAAGAMDDIPDGALVEVDPVAGQVRVLSTTA
jgi:phosphohistidine swiveling domain-containing protein